MSDCNDAKTNLSDEGRAQTAHRPGLLRRIWAYINAKALEKLERDAAVPNEVRLAMYRQALAQREADEHRAANPPYGSNAWLRKEADRSLRAGCRQPMAGSTRMTDEEKRYLGLSHMR